MLFFASDIGSNVADALSSMNLWIAVCKSVFIILLGFILTKFKTMPDGTGKILTKFVMMVSLPCLAFGSFMTSITKEKFDSALFSFVYGFIVYIIFIFLAKGLFFWVKDKTKRTVLEVLFVFGSTTFFGQPLIKAVFPNAFNDSSMFNVAYRVFLYSYAYYVICGKTTNAEENVDDKKRGLSLPIVKGTLKKIFVNPIIIATFLGFILWSLQLVGDSTDSSNWWVVTVNGADNKAATGAFWNLSVSAPWLYQTINTLGSLSSPLVWFAIGCTLGKVSFKEAASDKMVWIYSSAKIVLAPLINFCLLLLINLIPGIKVTFDTVAATTLMWAVPPATVAVTYCINSNKESAFASSCSLISTFVAVVFIPVYMILLTLIQNTGIFA